MMCIFLLSSEKANEAPNFCPLDFQTKDKKRQKPFEKGSERERKREVERDTEGERERERRREGKSEIRMVQRLFLVMFDFHYSTTYNSRFIPFLSFPLSTQQ